jgi:hypothetical protein
LLIRVSRLLWLLLCMHGRSVCMCMASGNISAKPQHIVDVGCVVLLLCCVFKYDRQVTENQTSMRGFSGESI